jgi:regulator of protease activity HflC (stomatin/prohibitin superfamily)
MFKKFRVWRSENKLEWGIVTALFLMLLILFIKASIVSIMPGHEAVRWERFFGGTELGKTYKEGTRFIWPWDKMYHFSLRLQEKTTSFDVLAKNGVKLDISVTYHFRPKSRYLPAMQKYIGPDYINILVEPNVGSHVRELFSGYEPEELFSIERQPLEIKLLDNLRLAFKEQADNNFDEETHRMLQFVVYENIFITSVILPKRVTESIELKESTKQQAMAYKYKLQIAEQEKLRKKIEAEGIRDFQNTITQGISEKYLKWKGIEATLELAKSENAKVVVIGSAKDGLPIILGSDYTASERKAEPVAESDDDTMPSRSAQVAPVEGDKPQ